MLIDKYWNLFQKQSCLTAIHLVSALSAFFTGKDAAFGFCQVWLSVTETSKYTKKFFLVLMHCGFGGSLERLLLDKVIIKRELQ